MVKPADRAGDASDLRALRQGRGAVLAREPRPRHPQLPARQPRAGVSLLQPCVQAALRSRRQPGGGGRGAAPTTSWSSGCRRTTRRSSASRGASPPAGAVPSEPSDAARVAARPRRAARAASVASAGWWPARSTPASRRPRTCWDERRARRERRLDEGCASRADAPATILLDDGGRGQSAAAAAERVNRGEQVLALDLAFVGEAWSAHATRHLLQNLSGLGERPLGLQAAELVAVARWLGRALGSSRPRLEDDGQQEPARRARRGRARAQALHRDRRARRASRASRSSREARRVDGRAGALLPGPLQGVRRLEPRRAGGADARALGLARHDGAARACRSAAAASDGARGRSWTRRAGAAGRPRPRRERRRARRSRRLAGRPRPRPGRPARPTAP